MPTFLVDAAGASGFNFTEVVDTLFSGIEKIITLFGKWPLSMYMGAALLMIGITIFRRLKRS